MNLKKEGGCKSILTSSLLYQYMIMCGSKVDLFSGMRGSATGLRSLQASCNFMIEVLNYLRSTSFAL